MTNQKPQTVGGYPANTRHWHVDKLVLHYADAKHPIMLMRVVGYTKDGLCRTQYIHEKEGRNIREVYKNDIANLLRPMDFQIRGNEDPKDWEFVRLWNFHNPPGTAVVYDSINGPIPTKTTSRASLDPISGKHPMVMLEGFTGFQLIRGFVEVV